MIDVRPDCLLPADQGWQQPTPDEVRAILKAADMTGGRASKFLGLSNTRVIRRWTGGDDQIPYSAWALLCAAAGLGNIWERQNDDLAAKIITVGTLRGLDTVRDAVIISVVTGQPAKVETGVFR